MRRVPMATLRRTGLVLGLLVSCGEGAAPELEAGPTSDSASPLGACAGAPAGLDGFDALALTDPTDPYNFRVYLAPAHPRPGQQVFALIEQRTPASITAYAHFTSDGWTNVKDVPLEVWCEQPSTLPNIATFKLHGLALGVFPEGANVDVAFRIHYDGRTYDDLWLSNGGANYRYAIRAPQLLAWVGSSTLRIEGKVLPDDLIPTHRSLEVAVETYPMGAARTVTLHHRSGGATDSTRMQLAADRAGPYLSNSQWLGTIPAEVFQAGRLVEYWVSAEDFHGRMLWDSRNGANYRVTPRTFNIGWAGGFGTYRPSAKSYMEGYLMNADGSTAIGCENHGASISSYVVRAMRVWVPGLTDRFGSDAETQAAARILTAEVRTNASSAGWTSSSMGFAGRQGNDFLFTFFSFNELCGSASDLSRALPNGSYEFKPRFSTDGGLHWFERGQADGPDGGANLPLAFGTTCSYFGDPYECHPPSGTYYTFDYTGGVGGAGGFVVRFDSAAVNGSAVVDWRLLSNKSDATQSFLPTLSGPDAAFFRFRLLDPATGRAYPAGRAIRLAPRASVKIEVTYAPGQATVTLPHQAELTWEYAPNSPGSSPHSRQAMLFFRGTAR